MLKLIDLLRLSKLELDDYKIHCASDDKRSNWRPLEQYYEGSFEQGQASQAQKNFECEHVLSLINLGDSTKWLFAGVYRVAGVSRKRKFGESRFIYKLEPVPGLDHLVGRAIVDFPKKFRASYLIGKNHQDRLVVSHICAEKMTIRDFPGFASVCISFGILRSIVRQNIPSWREPLVNIAGVYAVTDRRTGKHYVGSANGGVGVWQRWSEYARSGHGGNRELRQLLRTKGDEYADHFQFSLLEKCDLLASRAEIISRESHWKNILMSREFGLNVN